MTGVGSTPRDLSEFIITTNKKLVAVERRLARSGAIDLSARVVAGEGIDITGAGTDVDPLEISAVLPDRLGLTGRQVTDWDDAKAPGFYWGTSAANQPAGSDTWWSGIVFYHSNRIKQLLSPPGEPDGFEWVRVSSDGGTTWSSWQSITSSRVMVPTATSGTLQADGSVVFTADSQPLVDGVFTSEYRRYAVRFEFNVNSANGAFYGRLRAGGANQVAANYQVVRHYGFGGSSLSVPAVNATQMELAGGSAVRHDGELVITRARDADSTQAQGQTSSLNASNSPVVCHSSGWYTASTLVDGIAFVTTSGGGLTLTGRVIVYGMD